MLTAPAPAIDTMSEAPQPWHQPLLRRLYASSVHQAIWSPQSIGSVGVDLNQRSGSKTHADCSVLFPHAEKYVQDTSGAPHAVCTLAGALLVGCSAGLTGTADVYAFAGEHRQLAAKSIQEALQAFVQAFIAGSCQTQVPLPAPAACALSLAYCHTARCLKRCKLKFARQSEKDTTDTIWMAPLSSAWL